MTTTGATFADAAAEWLRYVEHDRKRRPSTVRDYRNAINGTAQSRVRSLSRSRRSTATGSTAGGPSSSPRAS